MVLRIRCLLGLTDLAFSCAGLPHSRNTTLLHCWLTTSITWSVNLCHPHFACELGLLSSTVSEALSKKTPCLAQLIRLPWSGLVKLIFSFHSRFL